MSESNVHREGAPRLVGPIFGPAPAHLVLVQVAPRARRFPRRPVAALLPVLAVFTFALAATGAAHSVRPIGELTVQ